MSNKNNSLSHTKWMCKYHIVFTPKYRRKAIYGQYRDSIGQILRQLCNYKGVEIIEGHLMPDHVHILVSIPPKYSVAQFMGYLKGKSSLMIFDKHVNLKYKFGNRHFWAEGIRQSMSRKANCLDNSVMGNFFILLKSELLYLKYFDSVEQFKKELIEYMEWYNEKRIKVKLKGLTPLQFRNQSLKSAWLKCPISWVHFIVMGGYD